MSFPCCLLVVCLLEAVIDDGNGGCASSHDDSSELDSRDLEGLQRERCLRQSESCHDACEARERDSVLFGPVGLVRLVQREHHAFDTHCLFPQMRQELFRVEVLYRERVVHGAQAEQHGATEDAKQDGPAAEPDNLIAVAGHHDDRERQKQQNG